MKSKKGKKGKKKGKNKEQYKESLNRMGVPIFPGDKVSKKDILQLPFQASQLKVVEIKELGIDKTPEGFVTKLHLIVNGGENDAIDKIYQKNKGVVEEALGAFMGAYTNNLVDRAALKVKSHNNENLWVDVHFFYNLDGILEGLNVKPFCYKLIERQ